jgi:tRNA G37 N-methylase Trm5
MFSKGNISEKARLASLIEPGEVVVDLFAGIGYFTVSLLKLSGLPCFVHACEWNPHAVRALRINLQQNGVADRCIVYPGDCRKFPLTKIATRISLGLLPSSRVGWATAVKSLSPSGGWLHVHENVHEDAIESLKSDIEKDILELFNELREPGWTVACRWVQRVKSYAPRVLHVVFDMECRPEVDRNSEKLIVSIPLHVSNPCVVPQPIENVRSTLRQAADALLCAAGKDVSVNEAQSTAFDAALLFRRVARFLDAEM